MTPHPDHPFPPGQHPARQARAPRARRSATPPTTGNVVPLRQPVQTAEAIAQEVSGRRLAKEREITALLHSAVAGLEKRHLRYVDDLAAIGRRMDTTSLLDLIEVGQRMLGQRGHRT